MCQNALSCEKLHSQWASSVVIKDQRSLVQSTMFYCHLRESNRVFNRHYSYLTLAISKCKHFKFKTMHMSHETELYSFDFLQISHIITKTFCSLLLHYIRIMSLPRALSDQITFILKKMQKLNLENLHFCVME